MLLFLRHPTGTMYKEINLDTVKYWKETQRRDEQWNRLLRREEVRERVLLWSVWLAGCSLIAVGLLNGWFDNVDVTGTLERIRMFFRS